MVKLVGLAWTYIAHLKCLCFCLCARSGRSSLLEFDHDVQPLLRTLIFSTLQTDDSLHEKKKVA